jgi:triosephosphate isomerase
VTGVIRKTLHDAFGSEVAQAVLIQYGGSVNERNAHDLLSQPEIDGALVGGASLDASRFSQIVQATSVIAKDTRKD